MNGLSVIFPLLFVPSAFAEDCARLPDGTLQKFVCDTKPAVLAALNPGLKLPRCADRPPGPVVRPGDEPVAGVFVTCTPVTRISCREIAKSVLRNGKGATVNVLVKNSDVVALERDLLEIARAAPDGDRLNVIPLESQPALYMRDPGLFRSDGRGSTEYVAEPYTGGGETGELAGRELAHRCGYGFRTPFAELSKYDSAYRLLTEDLEGQLTTLFGASAARYSLSRLHTPEDKERFIRTFVQQKFWGQGPGPDGKGEINDAPVMGGNFLGLPGGTLVAGTGGISRPDPEILAHFAATQKVMTLELPKLVVGHVDEVFNVVPAPGACGFALLRASPREMRSFLEARPPEEELGNVRGTLETVRSPPAEAAHPRSSSVADALADAELMRAWDEMQKTIDTSTDTLLAEVARTKGCRPKVVDLPVYWSKDGEPLLSNPVNGLAVNGAYFRSETRRPLLAETGPAPYPALDRKIRGALSAVFGKQQFTADTRELDAGNGNFHCATTNVHLPCQ